MSKLNIKINLIETKQKTKIKLNKKLKLIRKR